ncbi:MAG: LysR family transcriptional regulator [Lautropia sp.]|nr:LysR family transcriptional regulator [Lautropia sp.]
MDRFGELMVFLRVVEARSFSGAARALAMSPSAVSKLVARLESRLGVRLFDRIAGSIRLTQEGERFQRDGQRVVDAMTEAENAACTAEQEVSGVLHVHTPLTFAKYLLAPLLPALLQRHPKLRIEFILGTARGDFMKDGIDVAIHSEHPKELPLIAKPIARRRWLIAAAPSYLRKHGTPTSPDQLLDHRCLNFTVRTNWNSWSFRENGALKTVDIKSYVGANQGELLHALALEGLGVVRLAEFHIGRDVREGRLIELLAEYRDPADDLMYVLYPHRRNLAPRVRAFLDFLDEHFHP